MIQTHFYHYLKQLEFGRLPGRQAQMRMSPTPLDPDFVLPRKPSDTAHPSSVLIPIYPDSNQNLHVVLTLRSDRIRHAGQISFPGGRQENQESLEETALRELHEEVGIPGTIVKTAGPITPLYLHRTDNQITPYVGILDKKPKLIPNPIEVSEIVTAELDALLSDRHKKREQWDLSQSSFNVPYWDIHDVPLWGATAMIMSEFLEIYENFRQSEYYHNSEATSSK
jgi:8-oxo-dGTP pyrophosphatase MutT (NUDIX family)